MTELEQLRQELAEERYRHDRLQDWDRGMTAELEKYRALEREGRLLVLPPCKVGDTVYVDFYGSVRETTIKSIGLSISGKLYISHGYCLDFVEDLGKRWFITREDAEAVVGGGE